MNDRRPVIRITAEAKLEEYASRICRAIEASEHGSANDAIQDMLAILRGEHNEVVDVDPTPGNGWSFCTGCRHSTTLGLCLVCRGAS